MSFLDEDRRFRLRPSMIMDLNRLALDQISSGAGSYRPAEIKISGSKHTPPGAHLVAELVEDLCDYVNDNWTSKNAIHLSAYVLWRLNWIHPFGDGNGRTSRCVSYLVLCVRNRTLLSGAPTIPDQIVDNKTPYYEALDQADENYKSNLISMPKMELLIGGLLSKQLISYLEEAGVELPRSISKSADVKA